MNSKKNTIILKDTVEKHKKATKRELCSQRMSIFSENNVRW